MRNPIYIFSLITLPFLLQAQSWQSQTSGTGALLRSVYFIDDNNGWIVGENGTVLHTTNSGDNWQPVNIPEAQGQMLNSVYFGVGAYFLEDDGVILGNGGLILETADGGATWQWHDSGTSTDLYDGFLGVVEESVVGMAVGACGLILNRNTGWVQQSSGVEYNLYQIDLRYGFLRDRWITGSNGTILHSNFYTDFSWTPLNSPTNRNILGLHIPYSNAFFWGWAAGAGGVILRSTDAGSSWQPVNSPGENWNAIHGFDDQRAVVVGYNDAIYFTEDGGQSWQLNNTGDPTADWYDVYFPSEQVGWVVGTNGKVARITLCELAAEVSVQPTSCGLDNGSAAVSITGDNGNASILWSTGETTDMIGGLAPGRYGVTVSEGGCEVVDEAIIFEGEVPDLSATYVHGDTLCSGEVAVVLISGLPASQFEEQVVNGDVADTSKIFLPVDMDGDNDVDILGYGPYGGLFWHENMDGAGNFGSRQNIDPVQSRRYAAAESVDLDQDGDMDVIAAKYVNDKVVWFENDGNQTFSEREIALNANSPRSVFAFDLNSDGSLDIVSAREGRITWHQNDGSQNFIEQDIATNIYVEQATAMDIDGDGDGDILAVSFSNNRISWFENDGNENFSENIITNNANGVLAAFGYDLDYDGDVDVLSASCLGDKVAWYENDGAENFTEHLISQNANCPSSVIPVDIDRDGYLDILAALDDNSRIALYFNDGNENFSENILSFFNMAKSVNAADLDSDGDVDILGSSVGRTDFAWYRQIQGFPSPISLTYTINNGAPQTADNLAITNDSTSFAIPGLPAGSHTIHITAITDANGCVYTMGITAGVEVLACAPFSVTATQDSVSCADFSDGSIAITPEGGTPPYTFTWSRNPFYNTENGPFSIPEEGEVYNLDNLSAGYYRIIIADSGMPVKRDTLFVEVFDPPDFAVNVNEFREPSCFGLSDGAVVGVVSVFGMSIPSPENEYSFQWSIPGENGSILENITWGIYSVTVTSPWGCEESDSGALSQPGPLRILAQNTSFEDSCPDTNTGSISVQATGGTTFMGNYTYEWSTGHTNTGPSSELSGLAAGQYTVTVYDDNGCAYEDTYLIGNIFDYTVSVTPASCNEPTGTARVEFANLLPAFTWSTGATSSQVTGLSPGTYTVTISAGGCEAVEEVEIGGAAASLDGVRLSGDTACLGEPVRLTLSGFNQNRWEEHIFYAESCREVHAFRCVDIDNDTDKDIAVLMGNCWDRIGWFENDGNENFQLHEIGSTGNYGVSQIAVEDLDEDGDEDIVTPFQEDGFSKLLWFENDGAGFFTEHLIAEYPGGEVIRSVYSVDLDLDQDLDILAAPDMDNQLAWFERTAGSGYTLTIIPTSTEGVRYIVPADLDMDGDQDIVSSASSGQVHWYENDGNGGFSEHLIATYSQGYRVFAEDLNNDNAPDIILLNFGGVIGLMNDGNVQFTEFEVSSVGSNYPPSSIAIEDLNQDGFTDIALYRSVFSSPEQSGFFWFMNDGAGGFSEYPIEQTLGAVFNVYASDLNDDGLVDLFGASFTGGDKTAWYEQIPPLATPISLTYTINNGAPQTVNDFDIAGDSTFFSFTGLPVGAHSVHVTELIDANGCVYPMDLFAPVQAIGAETQIEQIICPGENYTWNNETYTTPGSYQQTFTSADGCDSLVTLNLDVHPAPSITSSPPGPYAYCEGEALPIITLQATPGATVDWYGSATGGSPIIQGSATLTPTMPGAYYAEARDPATGCTGAERIQVEVTERPAVVTNRSETTCVAAEAGVDTAFLSTAYGCDSLAITTTAYLAAAPPTQVAQTTCVQSNAGQDTLHLQSVEGCDSIVIITTTYQPIPLTTVSTTTCYWAQAGIQRDTLSSYEGCDSLVVYERRFDEALITRLPDAATCDENLLGMDTIFLATPGGCDSLVIQTWLPAEPLQSSSDSTICAGQRITWAGQVLDEAGVYEQTLTTAEGCDSIASLQLFIQDALFNEVRDLLCPGETYTFGNILITSPGAYTQFFTTEAGCDSTVELTLEGLSQENFRLEPDVGLLVQGNDRISLSLTENDRLPEQLSWNIALATSPNEGFASVDAQGRLEYELANPGFLGVDSFSYEVCLEDCFDACREATVRISTLRDCREELEANLPTGFTPDGDGANDLYDPLAHVRDIGCLQDPKNAEMTIISRWGEVVYEASPYRPWDGTAGHIGKAVPQGVYYCILRFELGEEMEVRKAVHVLRGR